MSTPLNPLVEKVRAKYPGVYDDISDVDLTKKLLTKYPQYKDIAIPKPGPEPKQSVGEIAKSAAVGAFEGVGVKPATTPGAVVAGTFRQAAQGIGNLVSETFKANETPFNKGTPLQVAETALDLVPTFIDKTATALEQGGRKAISAYRRKDYEEAAEQGASTLTSAAMLRGGKPTSEEAALSDVGKLRKSAAGKVQGFARKATGVETAVKESVGKAAEKHGEAITEHADQTENLAHRTELAKTIDTKSNALGKHLSNVEGSVAKEANAKFNAVREKIGNPEAPPDALVATVQGVEKDVLQDIPENIKEFRAIIAHGGEAEEGMREAFTQATGKEPLGGEPLTWDKLQSLKSRLDARLRRTQGMNGDLKRGLYITRDSVVDEMGKMADANGAQGEWKQARDFWRQYKEDFHEPQGPSGSGSPVAQSLNAVDPQNIRQPFLRTQSSIGNRGTEILRKYPQHGGNEAAAAVDEIVGHHQELQNTPNRPKGFSPDRPPASPTVDVDKVSREKIAQVAKNWGSFNARDVGILGSSFAGEVVGSIFGHGFAGAILGPIGYESAKYAMSRTMNKPGVINWLAKTPPEEMAVLNKIPGADKVKLVDGITKLAIDSKATELSPSMKAFLGARNVARIMAASTPSVVKTPGEAKERMREAQGSMSKGMTERGNINLHNRPRVKNPDGTISTIRSITIEDDGKFVLIPTVVGDRVVSDQKAKEEYRRTGKHLGKFTSEEDADRFAEQEHEEQDAEYPN